MASQFKEILYSKQDGVGLITLNRPGVLNAFSSTMMSEWVQAIEDAKYDAEVRVVVVTGAGRGFCTGADLKEPPKELPAGQRLYEGRLGLQRLPRAVESLDKPYVAAINGPAVGGGFDAASMADIRIASDRAKFSINHLRVSRVSVDGGYYYLTRIIGLARTLELVFTYRFFDADEAMRIGYVHEVVPHEELMPHVMGMARAMAKGPPIATQLVKRLIYRSMSLGLDEHLEDVEAARLIVSGTQDYLEGPRAWAERRDAAFLGQ